MLPQAMPFSSTLRYTQFSVFWTLDKVNLLLPQVYCVRDLPSFFSIGMEKKIHSISLEVCFVNEIDAPLRLVMLALSRANEKLRDYPRHTRKFNLESYERCEAAFLLRCNPNLRYRMTLGKPKRAYSCANSNASSVVAPCSCDTLQRRGSSVVLLVEPDDEEATT